MYKLVLKLVNKLPKKWKDYLLKINFRFFGLFHITSYAQVGEDIVLTYILPSKGFYIDIGAHHPKIISNTYKLYKKGRHGINIDPLPGTKKLFTKYRNRDINLEIGVGKNKSKLTYYMFEASTNNTFDAEYAKKQIQNGIKLLEKKQIEVLPLSEICKKYNIKKIDFLNIDVEGIDLEILESIDWENNKPDTIAIEIHGLNFNNLEANEVYLFLKKKGYKLNSYLIMTAIFTLQK